MSLRSPQRRSSIPSHRESGRARSSSFRRSVSPRSDSRARSVSRSPSDERDPNEARLRNRSLSRSRPMSRSRSRSRSRSPSRSRSRSRGRGYRSRSRSYTPIRDGSPPRSSKVCSGSPWLLFTAFPPTFYEFWADISLKVVVEKLTKNVSEAHLREIFGRFGDIQNLDLPMNWSCKVYSLYYFNWYLTGTSYDEPGYSLYTLP